MASIDKTYLIWEDYLILKAWCKNTTLIYDNGEIGSPLDFLVEYEEPYEGENPVWNTPVAFDRWLYENCPLSFIQDRLKQQYGDPCNVYDVPEYEKGTHYRIIKKPQYNWRCKDWYIDIISDELFYYGFESRQLYHRYMLMPSEMCHVNSLGIVKNLTKRKLNRIIKKLKLPIGTNVRISNRYVGTEYIIQIC